jgi:hypothetical protein
MSTTLTTSATKTTPIQYKIILIKPDNKIASDIFAKINTVRSENRIWLEDNTNTYIYKHLESPFYEKKDIETIIYNYGIQKAIQYFWLNKKYADKIMKLIDSDESKIYYGMAYYILCECFDYRIIQNEPE